MPKTKTFTHPIQIAHIDERGYETVEALAGKGDLFTIVPSSILARLGITPDEKMEFALPDGGLMERDMAHAWIKIDGRKVPTIVIFDADAAQPILGDYTLDGLGLKIDEPNAQLIERPYMFAATPIAVAPIKPPAKQEAR